MIHVWIKYITFWGLIRVYRDLRKHDDILIFYHTFSKVASLFARLFEKGLFSFRRIVFRKIDYQYTAKDDRGKALIYKVEQGSAILAEEFFNEKLGKMEWLPKVYENYRNEWKRMLKSSLTMTARESLMTICIIENIYRTKERGLSGVNRVIVYIHHSIIGDYIKRLYALQISASCSILTIPSLKYNLMFFPFPGKVFQLFLQILSSRTKKREKSFDISPRAMRKGIILEEYWNNLFKRYPLAGQLFWFPEGTLPPEQVVLYFDRPDSPCDQNAKGEIKSYGFGWLNMDNPWRHIRSPIRITVRCLLNAWKAFPGKWNEFNIWLWVSFFFYSMLLECFREIYRTYNVRIIHQHQEWWPSTLVKSLAIRLEGGKTLWNHWSVDHYPIAYFNCGLADLVLSWGQLNDGFINAHDFSYQFMVRVGRVAGDGFNRDTKFEADNIRKQFSPAVTFIITIFDSSHSNDGNSHQSTSSMLTYYEKLLLSVLEREHWGALIKTKGNSFSMLPNSNKVYGIFKKLEMQKRCILLDGQKLVSLAAFAGDVTVCYGINSAGILAALCNKQTLHWDLCGCLEHPLYQVGGGNRIIFKTYDKVLNALLQIEAGDTRPGNHDEWLYLFDEFQDEQGNLRAAEVIGRYMKYLEHGMNHNSALEKSVEEFSRRWGNDKVSTPVSIQSHLGNELWRRVIKNSSERIKLRCQFGRRSLDNRI